MAAGSPITWNMVALRRSAHRRYGIAARGRLAEMATGEGKTTGFDLTGLPECACRRRSAPL